MSMIIDMILGMLIYSMTHPIMLILLALVAAGLLWAITGVTYYIIGEPILNYIEKRFYSKQFKG